MASAQPLLPPPNRAQAKAKHTKFSIFYGADEYLEQLSKKYEEYDELAALLMASPDGGHDAEQAKSAVNKKGGEQTGKMLTLDVDENKRSHTTKRAIPTPNIPEPMPPNLAFMFTKVSPEQKIYMWNIYTMIFVLECLNIIAYWAMLRYEVFSFGVSTFIYGFIMVVLCIQNVYILHDVIHGATFPPYEWQNYITHPLADFISIPWMDLIMEHNRHHNSTFDLLNHGEFGWDPANWLYTLQELSFEWYGWFTVPLVPLWHFVGANDTGFAFACLWWLNFPDSGPGGKCDKGFYNKWLPVRAKHVSFQLFLWTCVWLLGSVGLGRPLSEGWRFVLLVSCFIRVGFSLAWIFIANFNHSHMWNEFLAGDPERTWPMLHAFMAFALGGRHRWNEMLFHDVHHMCPGRIGAMSQRGRFHGWQKVHDACVEILSNGLWKSDDAETIMESHQKRRSLVMKSAKNKH
mmetsp:Transcript_103076/g.268489  ORF Transcript_103076/g.268489 Transcript_103076/m.268489 type:complete len:460 (-) Transcript_103076:206-1585(-)